MTQYRYPFPLDTITVPFGVVDAEHRSPHRGTDFAPGGLPIPAISDGVVVRDETQSGLGNLVTVQAPDGVFWSACHMVARSPLSVGDTVSRGDIVGTVGNTGSLTTGRHLHFTMSSTSSDPAVGSVFDCVPYITARLSSTAGTGTTPFERMLMALSAHFIAENPTELVVFNNETGGRVSVFQSDWDLIQRVRDGDGNPKELISSAQLDVVAGIIQKTLPKSGGGLSAAEIADAVNDDAANRLKA